MKIKVAGVGTNNTLIKKKIENRNKTNKHKDSLLFCTENKFGGEYLCTA